MSSIQKLAESLQTVEVELDQAERLVDAYVDGVFGALTEKRASFDTEVAVLSDILLRADPKLAGHIKEAAKAFGISAGNPLAAASAGPDNPREMLRQNPDLARAVAKTQHPLSADPLNPTAGEQLIDAGHAPGASAPTPAPLASSAAQQPSLAQARAGMAAGHGAGPVGEGLAYAGGAVQSAQNFASPYLDKVKAFLAQNSGGMGRSIGGGAVIGGLGGLLASGLSQNKDRRKHWFRNALLSALAGGGSGYLLNQHAPGAGQRVAQGAKGLYDKATAGAGAGAAPPPDAPK